MPNSTLEFQCLVGMQCKDFAIIAADQTNTTSIIVTKHGPLSMRACGQRVKGNSLSDHGPCPIDMPVDGASCSTRASKSVNKMTGPPLRGPKPAGGAGLIPSPVRPVHKGLLKDTVDFNENKLYEIQNRLVMGAIGDPADRVQFVQFIDKNVQLYQMRNGYPLNTAAVVHFSRNNMMESLKGGNPSMVNILIAGYDEVEGGQLYTVDFLACALRVPFGVHGFGGLLSMGILDRFHKPELTEFEAYEVIKRCVHEVHERLFVSLPNFMVKVVNKHGIKEMPAITPATYLQDHPT